jgi:HEAT repeat protein
MTKSRKIWLLVLCGIVLLATGAWFAYTSLPGYRTRRLLAELRELKELPGTKKFFLDDLGLGSTPRDRDEIKEDLIALGEDALPELIQEFCRKGANRYVIGRCLEKIGTAVVAFLEEALASGEMPWKDVLRIAGDIRLEVREATTFLLRGAAHEDPDIRGRTANEWWGLPAVGPEEIKALISLAEDKDASVRERARNALCRWRALTPELVSAKLKCLQSPSLDVRLSAFLMVVRSGQVEAPEIVTALATGLGDEDTSIRKYAARALCRASNVPDRAVGPLSEALKDQDPEVRSAAVRTLGRAGPKATAALPALTRALSDKDSGVRQDAAWAVKKIQTQEPEE